MCGLWASHKSGTGRLDVTDLFGSSCYLIPGSHSVADLRLALI